MISRIILENYMSHRRSVIEPAPGLTVLIGPNNCGKSAIIHALQAICYNKPNEFAISHDQEEASVTIETDDGHVLKWRRKRGGSVSYEIDGEATYRLGRGGVPDALHAILRMPKIEFADQPEFDVHFGLQKSPLFLLGDTPARAAGFFASSSDAERLLQMQRLHREKVRDARRESGQLDKEIEERDATLNAMAPLPRLQGEIARLESSHAAIEASDGQRALLSNHLVKLNAACGQRKWRSARAKAIEPLRPVPHLLQTAGLQELIEKIRQTDRKRAWLKRRLLSLSVLQAPRIPHDTARLSESVKAIRNGISRKHHHTTIITKLMPLRSPPTLSEVSALLASVRVVSIAAARRNRFDVKLRISKLLRQPPESLLPAKLESSITSCAQVLDKSRQCREKLAQLDAQLQAVRDASRLWTEEHPQCPVCGSTTDAELVLAGGHAHEH